MSKKAFDRIAEGLTEALSIARGETKPVSTQTNRERGKETPQRKNYIAAVQR